MTRRLILACSLTAALAATGCTLIADEPAAPTWRDLIIDVDCAIEPQMDGSLAGEGDDIVIGEDDYFALIINQGDFGTFFGDVTPFIDIARNDLEIGDPRLVANDQGGHTIEGATPYSLEPDTFYTRISSDFGQQIVVDIPPGTYTIYGRHLVAGQAGTCPKPQT
ncbi:MAG: hypothetical protein HKN24_08525 [Acidimicrobiales bacterium]|nr:hypothetical protein [Acidimicrobiales bacterium]